MCFSWSVEGGWFVLYLKRVLLLLYLWLKGHWTTTITMLWNKKLSGMFVVGYNHVLKSDYVGNSFKIIRNALTLIRKVAFEIGAIFCLFCCFLENLIFKKKSLFHLKSNMYNQITVAYWELNSKDMVEWFQLTLNDKQVTVSTKIMANDDNYSGNSDQIIMLEISFARLEI